MKLYLGWFQLGYAKISPQNSQVLPSSDNPQSFTKTACQNRVLHPNTEQEFSR